MFTSRLCALSTMRLRFLLFSLAFMIAATSVALADNQTNETNVTCVEDVNCDEWAACIGGLQTAICRDSCGNSRQYVQRCELPGNQTCIADVNCTEWTACSGSSQTRICTDSCENKMQYIQSCTEPAPAPNPPSSTTHMSSGGYIVVKKNSTATTNVTNATNVTTNLTESSMPSITTAANDTESSANETQSEETSPASGFLTALSPLMDSIRNFLSWAWNGIRSALGLQ